MTYKENNNLKNINLKYSITEPWEVVISISIICIGIIISNWYSFFGAAINLLGLWNFVKYNLGAGTMISKFLPKKSIDTQIFISDKISEDKKNLLLLIPDRFYIPETKPIFERIYQGCIYIYIIATSGSIFWLYSKDLMQNGSLFIAGNIGLFILQICFLIIYIIFHKSRYQQPSEINFFSEMIDNETDIPNLHVLRKPDVQSISALNNFIRENDLHLNPQNTLVVNISKFLSDRFLTISGEGIVIFHEYNNLLIDRAKKLDMPNTINKIYISDLIVFQNSGFSGISLSLDKEGRDNQGQLMELLNY